MTNVPFSGIWRGHHQVQQFFGKLIEVQDVIELEPEEFVAQGNQVVVLGHFAMHVKETGKTSRSDWVHVWTFEGDKVTRMREYVDTLAVSRAHSLSQTG